MSNGLDNFADAIGDAIKIVPELYDDALKPAAQTSGKILNLIPQTIYTVLLPIRKWVAVRENNMEIMEKLLAQKLEHTDPQNIVTPEAYVAVPAIQALSYSMDSDELRNLYANLLAKSMMVQTKDKVHPAFVDIIKQLSPLDAKVFKIIMEREINPIIDLIYVNKNNGQNNVIETNVTDIDIAPTELIQVSIDNLIKQNLISIPIDKRYADDNHYNKITSSQHYIFVKKQFPPANDGRVFSYNKHVIEATNLGRSFYGICVRGI